MQNNLCTKCDGRGFHWKKELLIERDGERKHIANLYSQGETCPACKGSGKTGVGGWGIAAATILVVVALVFIVVPLFRLAFS